MSKPRIFVTKEEQKAISSLERISKKWPKTLMLFSFSGSLMVVKNGCEITQIQNIENDGGDPGEEIKQSCEVDIDYE